MTTALRGGAHRPPTRSHVTAPDGSVLPVTSAGDPHAPAVLIASACGMPAELTAGWVDVLAPDHHVLTWESRGLFAPTAPEEFDARGQTVADQVADMTAVLDAFGVRSAHVMGLCGGAVLAVRAAASHPDRVGSMSLWHGDFELGPDAPKTSHQRNLQALMTMAAESRESAAMVHDALRQTATAGLPEETARLVLHPYRDAELLYRYCRLNGALMAEDVRDALPRIDVPALVVTSEDDHTAHPDGSRAVARALSGAELQVTAHGDHISLFAAGSGLTALLAEFLAARTPG